MDFNEFFVRGSDLNVFQDSNFMVIDQNIRFVGNLIIPQPKVLLDIPYVFEWAELSGKYIFNFTYQGFALLVIIVFLFSYFAVDKTVDFIRKKIALELQENVK